MLKLKPPDYRDETPHDKTTRAKRDRDIEMLTEVFSQLHTGSTDSSLDEATYGHGRHRTVAHQATTIGQAFESEKPSAQSWPGRTRTSYDGMYGYKELNAFVAQLKGGGWITGGFRMTILTAGYMPGDRRSLDRFVVVFSQPIRKFDSGKHTVYRHVVFENVMRWDHPDCVLDTKALAKWFRTRADPHAWIPIVPVPRNAIDALGCGRAFPGIYIPWGFGGYDQFQDRIGTPEVLWRGKAVVNSTMVQAYLRECGLDRVPSLPA